MPGPPPPPPPLPSLNDANAFLEKAIDTRATDIENRLDADVISLNGPIVTGVDDLLRKAVETKYHQPPQRIRLALVLTTGGGSIEVVQRIVDLFRRHYSIVDFIVPNCAYSAGTVLALSGDAIYMDSYSRLGPIDPQIIRNDGSRVPALGYLERYNKLLAKANKGHASTAEIQLLVSAFDQGELYQYEHHRELSITLLKQWLVAYKFKDWKVTRSRQRKVTLKMKQDRAAKIAKDLNNTEKWHIHGYGISKDVLEGELNLMIDDFGSNPDLSREIRGYYELMDDYMAKRGSRAAIHFAGHYTPYI